MSIISNLTGTMSRTFKIGSNKITSDESGMSIDSLQISTINFKSSSEQNSTTQWTPSNISIQNLTVSSNVSINKLDSGTNAGYWIIYVTNNNFNVEFNSEFYNILSGEIKSTGVTLCQLFFSSNPEDKIDVILTQRA